MSTFSGKTAIVTGAAGGIGGGVALRLADGGADLALFDIDEAKIEPIAEKCRTAVERKSGGVIVIVSSGAAVQHVDQASAYSVSKAGVKMMTECLASELGPHRIRVNGVMPGLIETGMVSPIFDLSPTAKSHLISQTPVGHFGTPDDVGALVAFLAAPDARYINGHSVVIDGGALLHDFQWFHQDYTESNNENWTMI